MRKKAPINQILIITLILIPYMCDARDTDNSSPSSGGWISIEEWNARISKEPNIDPTKFVEEAFNGLPPGWIVYTAPNETRVGNNELVEARIARNITLEIYKDLCGRGTPELGEIEKVGTRMRPDLRAENGSTAIDIEAQFPDVAADRPLLGNYTEWKWKIIPLISGPQKLTLDVYTVLEVPPYPSYYYQYPVFSKTILVDVNPLYTTQSFLAAHWEFLIASIFGPIVGFVAGRYLYRK